MSLCCVKLSRVTLLMSVDMLSDIVMRVIMLIVVMLNVIIQNVFMLSEIKQSNTTLSVNRLSVIMKSDIMLRIVMLNVVMLSVVMLNVVAFSDHDNLTIFKGKKNRYQLDQSIGARFFFGGGEGILFHLLVAVEGFEPSNLGLRVEWYTTVLPRQFKILKNLSC
jgi:hypothetical protein